MRDLFAPHLPSARQDGPPPGALAFAAVLEDRMRWKAAAFRLVGDRNAADDVLQIAFLRVLTRSNTLRDPERFQSWFRRVLANVAVDYIRRGDAYQRTLHRSGFEARTESSEAEPEEVKCACLHGILVRMIPAYAEIIRKVDLEGCSVERVAQAAGITATNARVRLHRARRTLRSRLAATCGLAPFESCTPCTCEIGCTCKNGSALSEERL